MWLYKSNQVLGLVMVLVVNVLAKAVVRARSDLQAQQKHFHIYGCQSNETISEELDTAIHDLTTRPAFLLGVSGNNKTYIRLLSQSSKACRLRPNKLYCVRPSTTENHLQMTLSFQEILFEEGTLDEDVEKECGLAGTSDSEEKPRSQDDNKSLKQKMTMEKKEKRVCKFRSNDFISLQSGYGFISCQGGPGAGVGQWREWLAAVTEAEAKAANQKNKILIGVMSGTGSALLLLLVCLLYRLRSRGSTRDPYHLQRRPSNFSARTASTNDHPSSRT